MVVGAADGSGVGAGDGGDEEEEAAVRWRPAWTRRMEEAGADVRRERRCWRCERGVDEGIVRGMAGCACQCWAGFTRGIKGRGGGCLD